MSKQKSSNIGFVISALLKESNMTQEELSSKIGISRPVISGWINARYEPTFENVKKLAKIFGRSISVFSEDNNSYMDEKDIIPLTDKNTIRIPIYIDISAGVPNFLDEDPSGYEDVPRIIAYGAKFAVRCNGDSMTPTISKGDICYIKPSIEAIDGKIMLVKVDDGFTLKRIKKNKGKIELLSDNKKYSKTKYKSIEFIGLVVATKREIA
ncbi:MAG: LexA family transcriptional regulator [Endomicrobium sp.]|jgi:SOS-response transcriptional repressor LexA|nr:LexA family transcriptional regulator [Endomicrobium sp.]